MSRLPVVVIVATVAALGAVVLGVSQDTRAASGGTAACVPAWTDVASPQIREGQLYSIVALSPTEAWAVGGIVRYDGNWNVVSAKPLVEHLDGKRWKVALSPVNVGNLYAVAAAPDGDVWAVGWTGRTISKRSPLVVRWSGGAWSTVTVPASLPVPVGVAAAGPRDVWIVGASSVGSTDYAEAWRFDGVRWQRSLHLKGAYVNAVVAVSENDVWAVGSSGVNRAAAFHWDGAKWSSYVRPAEENYDRAGLFTATAVAADDVWAGGFEHIAEFRSNAGSPIVRHWNGRRWASMPEPAGAYEIDGLAVLPAGEVLAVGTNDGDYWEANGAGVFTATWSGTHWRTRAVTGGRALYGVAAVPGGSVSGPMAWAAGQLGSGETNHPFPAHTVPLIRRYGC